VTLDILIRNGSVADGTGGEPFVADVGVLNGRIAAIGKIEGHARQEIDASGLMVTPGFIDIHSHSDYTLLVDPRAQSAIQQGVTLEVIGNCGHGCFPIRNVSLARRAIYGINGEVPLDWTRPAQYFERLERARPAVNVLSLVPNGQLRLANIGVEARPASPTELRSMIRDLEEGLEAGAFGYSTGLEYAAEAGASRSEIETLCRVVAKQGGLYATHTRYRDEGAASAVAEALETARAAEVRLQISHLLPRSGRVECERCVDVVDEAIRSGQDVSFDMHTRLFGLTFLHALLPPWLSADDPEALRTQLQDADVRRRVLSHRGIITASGNWRRLVLLDNEVFPGYARRNFEEIAEERGQPPGEAAIDLLMESLEAAVPPMVIAWVYGADDQELAFRHDHCVPGSDATTLCRDGPLSSSVFHGAYSWAAFFFRFMVRERKVFTAAEAVRRLSSVPAQILGLSDRGRLKTGLKADIAVFDPEIFGEHATTFEPNRLAAGMWHVVVNGALTMQDGALTGIRAGQVVRRH
jgi:N-acyl-D-aspartate/D-glutamate deacylase